MQGIIIIIKQTQGLLSAYFAETENFLLKVLQIKINVS